MYRKAELKAILQKPNEKLSWFLHPVNCHERAWRACGPVPGAQLPLAGGKLKNRAQKAE